MINRWRKKRLHYYCIFSTLTIDKISLIFFAPTVDIHPVKLLSTSSASFGSKNLSITRLWWSTASAMWSIRLQSESIPRTWRVSVYLAVIVYIGITQYCTKRIKPHGHWMPPWTMCVRFWCENYHENMACHLRWEFFRNLSNWLYTYILSMGVGGSLLYYTKFSSFDLVYFIIFFLDSKVNFFIPSYFYF